MQSLDLPSPLRNFVVDLRSKGLSDAYILQSLVDAGWEVGLIEHALQSIARPKKYKIHDRVQSFVATCISKNMSSAKILDALVGEGWAVPAIEYALERYQQKTFDAVIAKRERKNFLSRHHKHFYTRKSETTDDEKVQPVQAGRSAGFMKNAKHVAQEHQKEEVIIHQAEREEEVSKDFEKNLEEQNTFLKEQLEALRKEYKDREEYLKQRESTQMEVLRQNVEALNKQRIKAAQDEDVIEEVEEIHIQPKKKRKKKIIHKTVDDDESDDTTYVEQSVDQTQKMIKDRPVVMMAPQQQPGSAQSLQAVEKHFSKIVERQNSELLYTNPIVPDKIHMVDVPQGDRVQTGIEGLDPVIEGGLRRFTTSLVAGGPGTGKSTFGLQFLVNGVLKYNEPGIYITFGESRKSLHMLGEQFGWDLDKLYDERKMIVKEYTPEQIDKIIEIGGGSVRDLVDSIGAKRIVIDTISAFALMYDGETAQRRSCIELFRALAKWGCTTIALAEEESGVGQHNGTVLEYESAAVILLYNERKGDLRQRSLEIFKMRGTKHAGRIFPMRIKETGIEVYPRETF